MGLPVILTLPMPGWSISTSISRCRILGFWQASSTVHRGPQGDGLLLHHLHGLGHSVVGEELLQDGLQLHVIFRPVGVGVKLWILDQIGLADDLAQLGEVVWSLATAMMTWASLHT